MSDPRDAHTSWDMSQERAFMENLLSQRFNFFLIVFSVVLAGAATATSQTKQTGILGIGCVLCGLVWLTVYRIHVKVMEILKLLHSDPSHPVSISSKAVKERGVRGLFGVNPIVGFYIALLCTVTLLVATYLSWTGRLKAS